MKNNKTGNPPLSRQGAAQGPLSRWKEPEKGIGKRVGKGWLAGIGLALCLSTAASAGELDLGILYDNWTSNYTQPFRGSEFFVPLSLSLKAAAGFQVYGQTEFGNGSYTDTTVGPTQTQNLTALSDTVIGGKFNFKSFSLPSLLDVALNLPTGDPTWESKQIASNIPTEFIDSRYRGRGFGTSAIYGLSFPAGSGEFGAAVGYLFSGAFNPSYSENTFSGDLKLGDSVFLAVNHVQSYAGDRREILRLSSYFFLPTQVDGSDVFQMGTNFNASYSWENPKALSFEVGAQVYLSAKRLDANQQFNTEPRNYFAPRFYLSPTYCFGDFSLAGQVKYVLANGYSTSDELYDGGGWLFGLQPSYNIKLDGGSALKVYAGFDYVAWLNVLGIDNTRDANAIYNLWTFGANYELKL